MDGSTPSVTPHFQEYSDAGAENWDGVDSDVFSRAGELSLTSPLKATTPLSGPDYVGTNPAVWSIEEAAPDSYRLRLTNATAFGTLASDCRILIQYPRSREVVELAMPDSYTLDTMEDSGTTGIGGWSGTTGLTVSEVGGQIKVVVPADAVSPKLYRHDWYNTCSQGHPGYHPKHWPPYRFARIDATCKELNDSTAKTLALGLSIGHGTMRSYNHGKLGAGYIRFDMCRPEGNFSPDTTNEYQTFLPQEQELDVDHWHILEDPTSWSWGPGAFSKVELLLQAGRIYYFSNMSAVVGDPLDYYTLEIGREFNPEKFSGYQRLGGEHRHSYYSSRHGILISEGRYGIEYQAIEKYTTNEGATTWSLHSVKESLVSKHFPQQDWPVVTYTSDLDIDPETFWDSGTDEYTSEDALFSIRSLPFWFTEEFAGTLGDATPKDSSSLLLSGRPLMDIIIPHAYYGDDQHNGVMTFYFAMHLRGRANGVGWNGYTLPEDEVPPEGWDVTITDTEGAEALVTDLLGYVRSSDRLDSFVVLETAAAFALGLYSRTWCRFANYFSLTVPGFICSSVYQVPLECVEHVFTIGENSYLELHALRRVSESEWEDVVTIIADKVVVSVSSVLYNNGTSLVLYSLEDGSVEAAYSDDRWTTHSHYVPPGPDNTPWYGAQENTWGGIRHPALVLTPHMTAAKLGFVGAPVNNPKMGGDAYALYWNSIHTDLLGRPNGVALGSTVPGEDGNKWTSWHKQFPVSEVKSGVNNTPLLPPQRLAPTREASGKMRVFYFTGADGAYNLRSYDLTEWLLWGDTADPGTVIEGPIDGDGDNRDGLGSKENLIAAGITHKHPSAAWDPLSGRFSVVTWDETGRTLALWKVHLIGSTTSLDTWEVVGPIALTADRILYGDTPSTDIPEQSVGLMVDRQGCLRCFWWDSELKHAAIITDLGEL
jgi:hypothetical protein